MKALIVLNILYAVCFVYMFNLTSQCLHNSENNLVFNQNMQSDNASLKMRMKYLEEHNVQAEDLSQVADNVQLELKKLQNQINKLK